MNIYSKLSTYDRIAGIASSHTSPAAAGIMIAVGSVGDQLLKYDDCNMFITIDAGHNWRELKKDAHKWAIGDHGAMIIMVNDEKYTDTV